MKSTQVFRSRSTTMCVLALAVFLGSFLAATQVTAQNFRNWTIECGKAGAAVSRISNGWRFRPSPNCFATGVFNQRAEIRVEDFPTSRRGNYLFSTTLSMTTPTREEFSIFSLHDHRDGCSPPFQLFVRSDGRLYIASDVKTGPGESCIRGRMGNTSPDRLRRDGTAQTLKILFQFDGRSGFEAAVWLDDKIQITGEYRPSSRSDAVPSEVFYMKHGVYSKNMFPFEMASTGLRIRKVNVR